MTSESSLFGLLRERAARSPDAPMLLDESGARLTFQQFRENVEDLAAALHGLGIGPGTLVTWQLPTRIEAAVLMFALARLGAVQNPIIHLYREREVSAVLRQSRPEFFIVSSEGKGRDYVALARDVAACMEQPPQILTLEDISASKKATIPPQLPQSGDEVRWILYTSGTTSYPKGARHTDGTLIAAGRFLGAQIQAGRDDVGTVAYPIAHVGGPMYLAMILTSGMSALLLEKFDPPVAMRAFRAAGVTLSGGSTVHYLAFLAEQRKQPGQPVVPTLRLLSGGGAPMPAELYQQIRTELRCGLTHAYGMTEVPMIAQGSIRHSDEQLANTEGSVIPCADVRIVRPDGALAAPGEEGEVRVRGAIVCRGYTDPALTAAAFDEDGFFRTGDLGVLRADGHLKLTGRLKDIIIRKGENVAAQEIEEILCQHPQVASAAVIGLPDAERGELVCAVVELRDPSRTLRLEELVEYFRSAGLMRQKIPEQLEIVSRLPRSETFGKVLKHELRARFGSAPISAR